jgi:nucleoid-associated protein YgaU
MKSAYVHRLSFNRRNYERQRKRPGRSNFGPHGPPPGAQRLAVLAKHVWAQGDTYASLASKHYGDISEPYWRLIYEFNRAVIGDHPNDIKLGPRSKSRCCRRN